MENMATQAEIIEAIADHLSLTPADLDPTLSIKDDLGLNPVEKADLLHDLAEKFQIIFNPGEAGGIETVGDLIDLVEDKLLE